MIYWCGKKYELIPRQYNGKVLGYLWDGVLTITAPKRAVVKGHIVTADGVIIILGRDVRYVLVGIILLAALVIVFWPKQKYTYYQATFAERPLLVEGVLFCNVVNEAESQVTVQFINAHNKSMSYVLEPGETLPYIHIDFVPEVIRYNGDYDFPLEVRSD